MDAARESAIIAEIEDIIRLDLDAYLKARRIYTELIVPTVEEETEAWRLLGLFSIPAD